MKIIVLKFGGTSVGSINRIKNVANIIASYVKRKYNIIVVSSAMSGVTNLLINKTKKLSKDFDKSEYDVVVSSGEQVACALIAGRLKHLGFNSQSLMGWQVPIFTDENYSNSKILDIYKKEVLKLLRNKVIPIIAGFQGINSNNRITTLGRGASDYTAIMLSKYFKATNALYTQMSKVL